MVVTSTIMSLYFLSAATAALEGQVENPAVTAMRTGASETR